MTAKELLEKGPTLPKATEDEAKNAWKTYQTWERWGFIPWTLEARAIALRQAARRFRARGKGRV